jgi:hypothetical protein
MFRGNPSVLSSETFEAESLKTIEIKYKLKNFDIQSENVVSHKKLKLMVYCTDKSSLLSKHLVQTLFLKLINSDSGNPKWVLTKKSYPDSEFVGCDKTEITIVIKKLISRKICCFCSCGSILGEQKFELRLPEVINEISIQRYRYEFRNSQYEQINIWSDWQVERIEKRQFQFQIEREDFLIKKKKIVENYYCRLINNWLIQLVKQKNCLFQKSN